METKELQTLEPQTKALVFGTEDPQGIISKATGIANALAPIVEKAKLYNNIQGKKYVRAEGWTTMAAMLGVFPQTEYCKKIEREGEIAYEARIILKHISGLVVGAGEAFCSNKEPSNRSQEYAIASMAQTRAVGKACRLSFSWIMALSGYEVTPYEEIPQEAEITPKNKSQGPQNASEKASDSEFSHYLDKMLDLAIPMCEGDLKKAESMILDASSFPNDKGKIIKAKDFEHLSKSEKWLKSTHGKIQEKYKEFMRNESEMVKSEEPKAEFPEEKIPF